MQQSIPVVDLRDFCSGTVSQRAEFVRSIGDALRDIGFFALSNHQVDLDLIRDSYREAETFFAAPEEFKKQQEVVALKGQRGYTSFGREHAKDHSAPDLKEFFHVGRENKEPETADIDYVENLWPDLPAFKKTFTELYRQLENCSMQLLDAISLYLGLEEGELRARARGGNTVLRMIHYPPIAEDVHPASVRAAAHEDINLITLLCEATAGGLELLQRDGSWLPIHALEGQIIVDSGDMLQQMTNGLLKSTTHRVVNPDNSRERRFSMPYFVHPRTEVSLEALPQCIEKTGGKKRFADITAGEYLNQRLAEIGLG